MNDLENLRDKLLQFVRGEDELWTEFVGPRSLLLKGLIEAAKNALDQPAQQIINEIEAIPGNNLFDAWRRIPLLHASSNEVHAADLARRLTQNFAGLIGTASLAMTAARDPEVKELRTRLANLKALPCFSGLPVSNRESELPAWAWGNVSGPAQKVVRAWETLNLNNVPVLAPVLWALYWLDPSRDLLIRETIQIPLAGCIPGSRPAELVRAHLYQLPDCSQPQLVEHPDTATMLITVELRDGLKRAWESAGCPPAMWKLDSPATRLQSGASLTAACAVGFQIMSSKGLRFDPGCLVLADLEDHVRLKSVGSLRDKFHSAQQSGIVNIVIARPHDGSLAEMLRREGLDESIFRKSYNGLTVHAVGTLQEACNLASGTDSGAVAVHPDQEVLGRYILQKQVDLRRSDFWVAVKKGSDIKVAVKVRRVLEDDDTAQFEFQRAQWARELRAAYRLSSSPQAEENMLTLVDAHCDVELKAFVMVFESNIKGGTFESLTGLLERRREVEWLKPVNLGDRQSRRKLWQGLHRVASGIRMMHEQRMLHRNVQPDFVYASVENGPSSFRLGNIEASLHVGDIERWTSPDGGIEPSWFHPKEVHGEEGQFSTATDWYGFGMLCALCFLPTSPNQSVEPETFNRALRRQLEERDTLFLSPLERDFILLLIDWDPASRLTDWEEISPYLNRLVSNEGDETREDAKLAIVIEPWGNAFENLLVKVRRERLVEGNLSPAALATKQMREKLRNALEEDLRNASLIIVPGRSGYWYALKGTKLHYVLDSSSAQPRHKTAGDPWQVPRAKVIRYLPEDDPDLRCGLTGIEVAILFADEIRTPGVRLREFRTWRTFLPEPPHDAEQKEVWTMFQHFLRFTNQIELLMRHDEMFPFVCDPKKFTEVHGERIWCLSPSQDERSLLKGSLSMLEFFQREQESGRAGAGRVVLGENRHLDLRSRGPQNEWEIMVDFDAEVLKVRSIAPNGRSAPPTKGFVWSQGHHGQLSLIERRQSAIDRLSSHGYLMRALTEPKTVWMDTGFAPELKYVEQMASALGIEGGNGGARSELKSLIEAILRARPIYTLQGPPGTGKSTLVSVLVGVLLAEDPSIQILITAQAHGAVDELRRKIEDNVIPHLPSGRKPIVVRLGARSSDTGADIDLETTALELLRQSAALPQIEQEALPSSARKWRIRAGELASELDRFLKSRQSGEEENAEAGNAGNTSLSDSVNNFLTLVRSSANIVYATTSAGDLSRLAEGKQFFDWTIVEEAGKAHGFDLALPMQAGHRWLLIGDSKQLEPYRIKEYKEAVNQNFHATIDEISALRSGHSGLVDRKFLAWWNDVAEAYSIDNPFQNFVKDRLETFEQIYAQLEKFDRSRGVPAEKIVGRTAGELKGQFRMHPDIATLVSKVYYGDSLWPGIKAGDRWHGIIKPRSVTKTAIVWLDIPWEKRAGYRFKEDAAPGYSSQRELEAIQWFLHQVEFSSDFLRKRQQPVTVAFLSPYTQQVRMLQNGLKPELFSPMKAQKTRKNIAQEANRFAFTVDSFQGNEADIVFVSLVRNNRREPPKGLGFLDSAPRMNVLISRASCLLVLVGSWDFFKWQTAALENKYVEGHHLYKLFQELSPKRADASLAFFEWTGRG